MFIFIVQQNKLWFFWYFNIHSLHFLQRRMQKKEKKQIFLLFHFWLNLALLAQFPFFGEVEMVCSFSSLFSVRNLRNLRKREREKDIEFRWVCVKGKFFDSFFSWNLIDDFPSFSFLFLYYVLLLAILWLTFLFLFSFSFYSFSFWNMLVRWVEEWRNF